MTKIRFAVLAAIPFLYAGIASAQTPAASEHQHGDMAAHHKEMCGDLTAHHAARLAYVETKLELTDAQKPLFNKWRQVILDNAAKAKTDCLAMTPKTDAKPTILDRQTHAEMMLAAHLDAMKASHAALQALYDSLTPAQRQVLDSPKHHHGMMMMHRMMGMQHDGMEQH
jgi:hypothetical protein